MPPAGEPERIRDARASVAVHPYLEPLLFVPGPAHVAGPARVCARVLVCLAEFPLANPLPSIPSAGDVAVAVSPLFGDFAGTTGLSDFLRSFISGIPLYQGSLCGPSVHLAGPNVGSPGSRTRCLGACTGSLTAQGPADTRDVAPAGVAFP